MFAKIIFIFEMQSLTPTWNITYGSQQQLKNQSKDSLKVNITSVPTSNFIKELRFFLLYGLQQRGFPCC